MGVTGSVKPRPPTCHMTIWVQTTQLWCETGGRSFPGLSMSKAAEPVFACHPDKRLGKTSPSHAIRPSGWFLLNLGVRREGEASAEPNSTGMDHKQDTGHSPRLPERRHPAHGVKSEFGTPVIVFVTICTKDRKPWLAHDDLHQLLRSVWSELDDWLVGRYVLMPEHIHLFAGRAEETSLDRWLKYWKADFTRRHGNPEHRWQSGHWDTRLRSHESYDAKWDYVRNNPVRHGLVTHVDDWPFQGSLNPLPWW